MSGHKKSLRSSRNKKSGVYEKQRLRTKKNRIVKHRNHIKVHPNDLQTLKLLT